MKIKYCELYNNDLGGDGHFEIDNFDGYKLFCKLYEGMEGEGSKCGVSEKEFKKEWVVSKMRDWLMIKNENEMIIFNVV